MATSKQAFIDLITTLAVEECRKRGYGYPQAFTCVSQACCESAYGTSELAKNANALFGIKANGWKGKVYTKVTKECYDGKTYVDVKASFRAYNSFAESVEDYFNFIEKPRYKASLTATTVKDCITLIKNGGYATSPTYVSTILAFYERHREQMESYREEKKMSIFSSVCTDIYDFGTSHSNPRSQDGIKAPTKIIPHHMAGIMDALACAKMHMRTSKTNGDSASYYISDDRIVGAVSEDRRPWTSNGTPVGGKSGRWADFRAVTIEVSNSVKGHPKSGKGWMISDKSYRSLVRLCADVCTRWNIVPHYDGTQNGTICMHKQFAGTACVPTDSEVLTRDGWVALKNIQLGDEIACADIDSLRITFEPVYDKVPTKQQDTYTNNELTATKDHRMVYWTQSNKAPRIDFYGNLLAKAETNQTYIPLAGHADFEGLPVSDDMFRFLIAVQADGHYMLEKKQDGGPCHYGVEFHFQKERKIERIKETLEALNLEYSEGKRSDGSVSIRVYNQGGVNISQDICEKHLKDKKFTWEWLRMSPEQAAFFLQEILFWDGCAAAKKYSSRERVNLDIVNAIAAVNGVGSRVIGDDVIFRDTPYITLSSENTKRNSRRGERQITEVSCVSVKTGIFLMRQHGKTFVVGNCPGEHLEKLIVSGQLEKDILKEMGKTPEPKPGVVFRVQVGAFRNHANAHDYGEAFKSKHKLTYTVRKEGQYYKVLHPETGFATKGDAELSAGALRKMGYEGAFVVPGGA